MGRGCVRNLYVLRMLLPLHSVNYNLLFLYYRCLFQLSLRCHIIMKKYLYTIDLTAFLLFFLLSLNVNAQKQIYIPDSLKSLDLNDSSSRWSWHRSAQTEDLIFFWEKGFGSDWRNPPKLKGQEMGFDLDNIMEQVQSFYRFFRDTLKFSLAGSKCDRYKMMVMINYSLDGTAYGGTYDNFIGALWVTPNRLQDRKQNTLAHELGHCFQLQIIADSVGDAWGGNGFFEMTSQWMLWHVNPNWVSDENYHLEAFKKLTHKAYLAVENIYHSPYVLEYWSEKHGMPFIAELYRHGRKKEDPVMTYKRLTGISQQEFNDEMMDCYHRLLNFDFKHAHRETRPYASTFSTCLDSLGKGRWAVSEAFAPEPYGFNAIKLAQPSNGKKPKVKVKRLSPNNGCELKYMLVPEPDCWYLLVMNAPKIHRQLPRPNWSNAPTKIEIPTIRYEVRLKNTMVIR